MPSSSSCRPHPCCLPHDEQSVSRHVHLEHQTSHALRGRAGWRGRGGDGSGDVMGGGGNGTMSTVSDMLRTRSVAHDGLQERFACSYEIHLP